MRPYSDDQSERMTGRLVLSLGLVTGLEAIESLLDIGCASGWLEQYFIENEIPVRIVGIEPDGRTLTRTKADVPGGHFEVASVLQLPFKDASFDAVVMFEVLEHIPKGTEVAAFREIRRVLRPGGRFIMSTPFAHRVGTFFDPAWYFGHRHYTIERLTAYLEETALPIERSFVRGGWWEISGTILLYLSKWILDAEPPFKAKFEAERHREFVDCETGINNVFVVARAS